MHEKRWKNSGRGRTKKGDSGCSLPPYQTDGAKELRRDGSSFKEEKWEEGWEERKNSGEKGEFVPSLPPRLMEGTDGRGNLA